LGTGEVLGFIAGAFTTFGFIPQVYRIFRLKSAHEISLSFTIAYLAGGIFWLAYGIVDGLFPVIIWNVIAVSITFLLFFTKLKYGRGSPTIQ